MKITIATALYPPDIAMPAPYLKELTRRLSKGHDTAVLTYGAIPETLPGVTLTVVTKRQPAPLRLTRYTLALFSAARTSDRVLLQNGASTELPALVVSLLYKRKLTLQMSDEKVAYHGLLRFVHTQLKQRVRKTINHLDRDAYNFIAPLSTRPEIHPLKSYPDAAFAAYERSWELHLQKLTNTIV